MPSLELSSGEEGIKSSGLLTNKVIRAFLSRYEVVQWPEVIMLATLHGVLCFEDKFGQQSTALTDLRSEIEQKFSHLKVHAACEPQSNRCHTASAEGANSCYSNAKVQASVINIQTSS